MELLLENNIIISRVQSRVQNYNPHSIYMITWSFYTKNHPIIEPKDLKGLKIRVQESVTAIDMVKNLGGSPTPISWGELYTALQQGVVDGAENNSPSFYLSKHYEICKFYSIDEHTMIPDVLIISIHMWNSLDKKEKNWLKEAIN